MNNRSCTPGDRLNVMSHIRSVDVCGTRLLQDLPVDWGEYTHVRVYVYAEVRPRLYVMRHKHVWRGAVVRVGHRVLPHVGLVQVLPRHAANGLIFKSLRLVSKLCL